MQLVSLVAAVALLGAPGHVVPQLAQSEPVAATSPAARPSPGVEIELPTGGLLSELGPLVRASDVLADDQMRDLLRNGFPARLHFKVELWSVGRWFDNPEGSTEWDVVMRYDPLGNDYRVLRVFRDRVQTLGRFRQYSDAVVAAEQPFRAQIRAPRGRARYYYAVSLDVEVLSLTDLDEVERWLRGELRPAVRGERNPATALTRGARTLMVRLLGGEKRHYTKRSPAFRTA